MSLKCRLGFHDYEGFTYIHPLTLEATGKIIYVCRRCSNIKEDENDGRKRGHTKAKRTDT